MQRGYVQSETEFFYHWNKYLFALEEVIGEIEIMNRIFTFAIDLRGLRRF
jgi:hypothetical protein